MTAHDPAIPIQLGDQGRPVGRPHCQCNALTRERIIRQPVNLRVTDHLQTVFQAPQKHIRRAQFIRHPGRQAFPRAEQRQRS